MPPRQEHGDDAPRDGDPVIAIALWSAVLGRVAATIGLRAYRYVDSIDYDTLDFTGGARRPWATPLLYAIAGDDTTRVVLQAVVGALAWVLLAREVATALHDRLVRRVAVLAVLALSLTTSITNWDTTMLSESLAVSMTALLFAAFLRVNRDPTILNAALVTAASLVWIFTRQNHLVLHGLIVGSSLAVLAVSARRARRVPRPQLAVAGGLLLVAVLAGLSYGRNTEIRHFNLAMVIGQRVITDADDLVWFTDHGMPLPSVATPGEAIFPEPLLEDDEFADWVADDGNGTYTRFLLTHPWETLSAPLEDFVADRPSYADPPRPDETMLSTAEAYGSARQVVPEPVEELLFNPGSTGTVLTALVATLALTLYRWRTAGCDQRWLIALLAIVLQWPALTVVWHASTAELGRLGLISAVFLRLGIITQLAFLADGWRSRGRGEAMNQPSREAGARGWGP